MLYIFNSFKIKISLSCIIISTIALIFFIIGLSTFLIGCDFSIQSTCLNYNHINANVTNYTIITHNCIKCVKHGNNNCKEYLEYTCYDALVQFTYMKDDVENTCSVDIYTGDDTLSTNFESSYQIGKQYEVYISKRDNTCHFKTYLQRLAHVGIAFLCLFGMTVIIGIIYACYSYNKKNNNCPHP